MAESTKESEKDEKRKLAAVIIEKNARTHQINDWPGREKEGRDPFIQRIIQHISRQKGCEKEESC